MKIALNIVPAILLILWVILVIRDFKKRNKIRKISGFENCNNYHDVKRSVLNNPSEHNLELLADLKLFRNRTLLFWFLSIILAAIILFFIGILTYL